MIWCTLVLVCVCILNIFTWLFVNWTLESNQNETFKPPQPCVAYSPLYKWHVISTSDIIMSCYNYFINIFKLELVPIKHLKYLNCVSIKHKILMWQKTCSSPSMSAYRYQQMIFSVFFFLKKYTYLIYYHWH